jgi:hypothetical protein
LIVACVKTEEITESSYKDFNPKATIRTEQPITVTNGMLEFPNYHFFEGFTNQLKTDEQDINLLSNAYTQLGVDVTQEYLPNLTDNPVCLVKEMEFSGFISKRKLEEDVINAALNSGNNEVFGIVLDPYLKTALNRDRSVKIGSRIFKFFENGAVVIVLNNDWVTYNAIKDLNYEGISPNENIFMAYDDKFRWNHIYNIGHEGEVLSEKEYEIEGGSSSSPLECDFSKSIKTTKLPNNKIYTNKLYSF